MKTRFYKILYKNKDVVYVGVTTRAITERFREHLISKGLNENYSVVEFDCVEHPEFSTLDVYYAERRKIVELEQRYIREELEKGSHLLNISAGGEWGCAILEKLRKEEFRKKFGSYDNYKEYKERVGKCKGWVENWVECRSTCKCKGWLRRWVRRRSENRCKKWAQHWVECRSKNRVKSFLCHWIYHRSEGAMGKWLRNWVINRGQNKVKVWLRSWTRHRSSCKVQVWLRNWVNCRTRSKVQVWLRNWICHRNYNF